MSELKRKKVKITHPVSFSGMSLDDAIMLLTQLKTDFGSDMQFEYLYDFDGLTEIQLEGTRDETDAEYEARLKKYLASAEKRKTAFEKRKLQAEQKAKEEEEHLRKLYEQLKQKFEEVQ